MSLHLEMARLVGYDLRNMLHKQSIQSNGLDNIHAAFITW